VATQGGDKHDEAERDNGSSREEPHYEGNGITPHLNLKGLLGNHARTRGDWEMSQSVLGHKRKNTGMLNPRRGNAAGVKFPYE